MKHSPSSPKRGYLVAILLLLTCAAVLAATYTYRCPACKLLLSYSSPKPGVKCPNDGWTMVQQ